VKTIPRDQVIKRLQVENVWWAEPHSINEVYRNYRRRAYFDLLFPLLRQAEVRRAVLLMGPRRVGKTVLLHHVIQKLLSDSVPAPDLCYISVDHPIYNNRGLEELLETYAEAAGVDLGSGTRFVFFDEVQYVREWEVHLKTLVDSYHESGAGRFTDFLLPPLTFHEYIELRGLDGLVQRIPGTVFFDATDIGALNDAFIQYLNFGGYPEVVFSEAIQADPGRFIKSDIIDKVLLRDLPSLYGIQDVQELNYLFTSLAYNTANEISLEQLSQSSGVAKNTIKRYIEYLEAAFLIKVVHRVDRSAKRFQRANFFKVYLTNPSMRGALFAPVSADDETIGDLAETAIFSQWFHRDVPLHYARWEKGEVDVVDVRPDFRAAWAMEVKWSDRYVDHPNDLKSVVAFCQANDLGDVIVTSRSRFAFRTVRAINIVFLPCSALCYSIGYNLLKSHEVFPTHQVVGPLAGERSG
jgi:predicted AAA+ superfamily ATPase